MANEVVMPRLGWTMETGRVVEWLKQDGDEVTAGEFLFLVETEKAVTEVEALDSGILRIPADAPALGEDVEVGARLAYIVAASEAASFGPASDAPPVVSATGPVVPAIAPGAVAPPVAAVVPVVAGDGVRGEALSPEVDADVTSGARRRVDLPPISPRARRAAAAFGVDWTVLAGSGASGRIVERDVLAAVG